jgi:hypothetical protein
VGAESTVACRLSRVGCSHVGHVRFREVAHAQICDLRMGGRVVEGGAYWRAVGADRC